jgi:hypothetical protein
MHKIMRSFSPSKLSQFVNEQLGWEQDNSHPHACHGPPHATCVEFHDDISPPRRLAAVGMSDPSKRISTRVKFAGAFRFVFGTWFHGMFLLISFNLFVICGERSGHPGPNLPFPWLLLRPLCYGQGP